MIFVIIILVLIIVVGCYSIIQIKKNDKFGKKRKKLAISEKVPTVNEGKEVNAVIEKQDNVEVLDLNAKSKNSIDEKADTLDLDDLFKTISLTKEEEERVFDFTLQRSKKK